METNGNKISKKTNADYYCKTCDVKCFKKSNWIAHLSTRRHENKVFGNVENKKNNAVFFCESCYFSCSHKSQWERHISTEKHMETGTEILAAKPLCSCGKSFNSRSGLWKHKKVCKHVLEETDLEKEIDKDAELVWTLVKQNQDFKDMMMEQQKFLAEIMLKPTTVINNITNANNNNNTQNNQFNLQFFLNETCKDAMNINEFIDSIQIQLEDLDYTGKHDYVKGLSNVIVRELKALDQKVRPMHCSDEKREVIYIKTNDVWEKDIDYARVTRFTKHLAHKKFLKIKEWVEEYPTCMAHDDKKNDDYLNILGQITSSFTHLNGSECQESMKKIIKTIAKQAIIQKNLINY
jgi:Zinc-finger of C2H2 type